jgi:hypothetical protein
MKLTEKEKELIVHALDVLRKEYEELLDYQPKFKTLKPSIDMCNQLINKIK